MGKNEGGLNMVNVKNYITCLKISVFKKIMNNDELKTLSVTMYPMLKNLEIFGYQYIDKINENVKNIFWNDILKHVKKILEMKKPANYEDFVNEYVLYNKNICVNQQTVVYRNWVDEGITKIGHLTKDNGSFLTYNEFRNKYQNVVTNFLTYNGLMAAIRTYMRKLNISNEHHDDVRDSVGWQNLKNSKTVIKNILTKVPNTHNSTVKWNNNFQGLDWKKIYTICHKTTLDTKLRWFQLRLLYRILPTNRFLFLRKIKTSEICDLCKNGIESIEHMFFDCPIVYNFWQKLKEKFIDKLPHATSLQLSKQLILFGTKQNVHTDKPFDLFILFGKYYVYSCKFHNSIPNADIYLKMFKYKYKIEKYCNENLANKNFESLWLPYQNLLV